MRSPAWPIPVPDFSASALMPYSSLREEHTHIKRPSQTRSRAPGVTAAFATADCHLTLAAARGIDRVE